MAFAGASEGLMDEETARRLVARERCAPRVCGWRGVGWVGVASAYIRAHEGLGKEGS